MFKFIESKIKCNKIIKFQFRQQVIYSALDGGKYFFSERFAKMPPLADSFMVKFDFLEQNNIFRINLKINNDEYKFDINNKTESIAYFINFIESIFCFKSWKSLVYVSSTDNVNDFFCIYQVDEITLRIMAILNANDDKRIIDACIKMQDFNNKFLMPLMEIEPFSDCIEHSQTLKKYSPSKVRLPIY